MQKIFAVSILIFLFNFSSLSMAKESVDKKAKEEADKNIYGQELTSVYATNGLALPAKSQIKFKLNYVIPAGQSCSSSRQFSYEQTMYACQVCGIGVKGELGFGGNKKFYDVDQDGKIESAPNTDNEPTKIAFYFHNGANQYKFSCSSLSASPLQSSLTEFSGLVEFLGNYAGVDVRALPPKEAKLIMPKAPPADGQND